MENVFPLRTAPSQMMASQGWSFRHHQVKTCRCLGENRNTSAVLPRSFLVSGGAQRLEQLLRPAAGVSAQQAA